MLEFIVFKFIIQNCTITNKIINIRRNRKIIGKTTHIFIKSTYFIW